MGWGTVLWGTGGSLDDWAAAGEEVEMGGGSGFGTRAG